MLMPFCASFPANSASAPGLFASSNCSSVPSVYESPAPPRAFLALLTPLHRRESLPHEPVCRMYGDDCPP